MLDLFCGAGGCAVGYHRAAQAAGIELVTLGVDIKKQRRYPYAFLHADAMELLAHPAGLAAGYDIIHASPPSQKYSRGSGRYRNSGEKEYPDLIAPVRAAMLQLHAYGIIENVEPAPLRGDLLLNGTMFGLKVIRKRKFELINWWAMKPGSYQIKKNSVINGDFISVYGSGSLKSKSGVVYNVPGQTVKEKWSNAMGIDWMSLRELAQAIPPAYTEYIGGVLFEQIKKRQLYASIS